MKPICVTMQAFGSYISRTTVDFSALGDNPIFLITGSTGGGKTTILDAMCFALYCKATGGRRSWGSMRSTGAPDDLDTLVEFSFQLGGESYLFHRSQSIHYVRGTGRREVREEHLCYRMENGEWQLMPNLGKCSETSVRECAQGLLGLTCEQFSQVIVLPQGDFLKLLRANSVDKAEILQTLFATKLWSDIAKAIKSKSDALAQKAGELRAARNSILEREEIADDEALRQKCTQAKAEFAQSQTTFGLLQQQLQQENTALNAALEISRKFEALRKLEQQLTELKQSAEQMQNDSLKLQQGRLVQQVYPYFMAAQSATLEKQAKFLAKQVAEQKEKQTAAALLTAQKEAQNIEPYRAKALSLAQNISKLEAAYKNVLRLNDTESLLKQKNDEISKQVKLEEAAIQQLNAAVKRVEKGEAYIRSEQDDIQKLPEYLAAVQRLQVDFDAFSMLEKMQKEVTSINGEYTVCTEQEQQANVKLEAMRAQLEQEEQVMRNDVSGMLASALTEGTPCPVCGSVHHPSPACHTTLGYDAKQMELLRKSIAEEEKAFQKLSLATATCKSKLDQKNAELATQQEICGKISQTSAELEKQLITAKELSAKSEKAGKKLQETQNLLNECKADLVNVQSNVESCKAERTRLEREAEGLRAAAQEIAKGLGDSCDLAIIQSYLKEQETQSSQLTTKAAELEKNLSGAQSEAAAAKANAVSTLQSYQEALKNDEIAAERFAKEATAANLSEQLDYTALRLSNDELARLEQAIHAYETAKQSAQQQQKTLTKELDGLTTPNLDLLRQHQADAQQQNDQMSRQIGSLQQRVLATEKSLQQLELLTKTGGEVENEFSHANRLSLLLSGRNPLKIPLQQFVLGIMLDDILSSANQFFSTLSHGRYSLNRVTGGSSGNSLGGLDLQVLDAFSGGTRSIETLSGGEQFLASLSLAFGLSDVVQGYSGSVHLDSIFIDEGFGSLDQETLDTAMKALMQIQKMGRTIGIISHVSELKSRIAAHIEVYKAADGGSAVRVKTE